ncbi:LRR receptor-like serine/threonine-protein kinase EFR [Apium graveolens]|uniref:LRR receptor-like serine/threonine-protein kinase EFR n=1 Tax=Apium graveolens TaxID=4045 RepID=UPI003D7BB2AB
MIFRFIILFLLTLADCRNSPTLLGNVTDQQALLYIKASITGDPHVLSSWNHSVHLCSWEGITCGRRHQRVTALNLSSQQLDGTLSPHIGNLSFLRAIRLDTNNFRGIIPGQIGQLFRLQYLHLDSNSFQGEFPMNLSHCSDIRVISIEKNNLSGKLPTDFMSWSKLAVFDVKKNHFIGSIPSSIGNISSLLLLDLNTNYLTGSIPLEVSHHLNLEFLQLSINNFSGTVPLPLYNISSIIFLSLTRNELEGTLPANFGFTLPNLQTFFAAQNRFSGPFPPSITNASKLEQFEIAYNNISGPLPMNFGTLLSLQVLNLGHNILGHNQPPGGLSFLGSLVNCTHLQVLGLYENELSEELPNSIVNLSTTLDVLDFGGNHIYGSIPQEIGQLLNMTQLILDHNLITGSIPKSICKFAKLGALFLRDNRISGVLPDCLNNITGLLTLSLDSNMLNGSIPAALFNISSLQGLSLFRNHLSGAIPENVMGLSSLSLGLFLHQNLLTGSLPSSIGNLTHLVDLRISDNKLTRAIPDSLGDCVMLEELHMEGNLFEGRIPSTFKALESLTFLDLSNNNMSGNIPHFLGELRQIRYINLSHNKLGGEMPKKGLFSNVSSFSVIGNFQLCGGIQALQLPDCRENISKRKKFPSRIVPLIVLVPLATLLACFTFVFCRIKKSKQKNARTLAVQEDHYLRLSYQDILIATNDFSLNNLLGEGRYGSVYKGVVESLQHIVAVKVLNVAVHGAYKNFLAECETLRNSRHRNLIKIITACSSTDFKGNDFKALVFEFMRNGSLDNWLHPSTSEQGNERNLTLFQRLNIAIDVAMAVDYLHHHCPTKIIHCDLKPSNILLDEDFVAHVGDFGLARFFLSNTFDINHAQTSSTGVRGTVGYVPPEYGIGGKISAEGDVYSYGIVLLELFSGLRPTGSSILMDHANNLHDYVRKSLPYKVMEIVDPGIILQQEEYGSLGDISASRNSVPYRLEVCLASILEIGVLCSVETPRERIDISVAIKKLHIARDKFLQCLQ